MIVLDGIVYQAKSDGKIYLVPDNVTTPFATVTYFDRMTVTTDRPMNLTVFSSVIRRQSPLQEYGVCCQDPWDISHP